MSDDGIKVTEPTQYIEDKSHLKKYLVQLIYLIRKSVIVLAMAALGSLEWLLGEFPRPQKKLAYGTAGFRDRHDLPLDSVFVRMGFLACLRSAFMDYKCVGIMITASHNPEQDNGIKIVDVDGGMLSQDWEPYAEELANADAVPEKIQNLIQHIFSKAGADSEIAKPVVVIGRDTRPHSTRLLQRTITGVEAFGGRAIDLGEVTTPQLHFVVQQANKCFSTPKELENMDINASLTEYYDTLTRGYITLRGTANLEVSGNSPSTPPTPGDSLVIDGSFGVGASAIHTMHNTSMKKMCPGLLSIDVRNKVGEGKVNEGCGAEFVQKGQKEPCGVDAASDGGKMMCSFDGDADRIVFHAFLCGEEGASSSSWALLDGDKISTLFALLLSQELNASGLLSDERYHFKFGVVQTAYANGSSTYFLRERGIPIVVAKTGVKFLHHMAQEFDVGVYFEANGHGTVLFSQRFLDVIQGWEKEEGENTQNDPRKTLAMKRLLACTWVINQAVGDAISDMLFVLAALQVLGLDLISWHKLYQDLPSRQLKVQVKNKDDIKCTDDETRAITPAAMQQDLDKATSETELGRCFVRPSGTEDVARVYAEAKTQILADQLAQKCVEAIEKHCN